MAKTRPEVSELGGQNIGFLFGTMMDLRMLPTELKHTGKIEVGEFAIVAHFPASHAQNNTEQQYLARHKTFRGGLYATYQDGPYKMDEINWDATNRAGVHMVTKTKYGAIVEFPTQPSKTMPGSMKLMVQEYVESLKTPSLVIRCSGLGGALEPIKGKPDEYEVVLLNGDIKCPKKLHSHVPAKYHAEDDGRFNAQVGPWSFNAEEIIDGDDTLYRQVTQLQKFDIVVDVNWETTKKVDTKYLHEIQLWADQEIEEWIDSNIEEAIENGDAGDWDAYFYPEEFMSPTIMVKFNWELEDSERTGEIGNWKAEGPEVMWDYDEFVSVRDGTIADAIADEYLEMGEDYDDADDYARRAAKKMNAEDKDVDGCCFCGVDYGRYGNNAQPLFDGRCCNTCNTDLVIPARISMMFGSEEDEEVVCFICKLTPEETDGENGPMMSTIGGDACKTCAEEQGYRHPRDMIYMDAEEFAARSNAPPNLSREKSNVKNAVSANYGSFKWGDCTWGPHFLRLTDEGSNKFYSVWVWERSPGVYTAMGSYGGLGQNPRLFNITQTADLQRAINEAQKKMNQKQNKGYQTY